MQTELLSGYALIIQDGTGNGSGNFIDFAKGKNLIIINNGTICILYDFLNHAHKMKEELLIIEKLFFFLIGIFANIDYFNPIQVVDSDKEYTLANITALDTGNVIPNPYVKDLSLTFDPKTDVSEGHGMTFGQISYVRGTATQLIRMGPTGENLTHPVLKQVCLPGDKFIAVNERYYLSDGTQNGYYATFIPVKEVIRAQDNTAEWNRLLKP